MKDLGSEQAELIARIRSELGPEQVKELILGQMYSRLSDGLDTDLTRSRQELFLCTGTGEKSTWSLCGRLRQNGMRQRRN